MVLGLFPPIPVAFDDPHQLQSYPRLDVHFSSSCRVFTRGGRLGSGGRGAGSCHGIRCLLLCRVLMPFPGITEHRQPEPCPLAPEVAGADPQGRHADQECAREPQTAREDPQG